MPGGRPSKYRDAYCVEVIETLAEGLSVTAFAGRIGVNRATVFNWANEHPEFFDALKVGQAKAAEFWEKLLVENARTGKGNATACIFGLKNRASEDWADKVLNEHSGPNGGPIQTEELSDLERARRLAFLLSKGAREAAE